MNRPVHFEIHVNDIPRAIEFYKEVFGWTFEEYPMGETVYWMAMTAPKDSTEKGINGGLIKRASAEPAPGTSANAYVCTMQVANIDETIAKLEKFGCECQMPKFAFPGMAWQAYYKDTEGNIIGIHQEDKEAK